MYAIPLHPHEHERLQALEELELLDTPRDPYMDSLVRIARDLFKVERALISLIDYDKQCVKAQAGEPFSATSRSASFCAYALLDPHKALVISDARLDERFSSNPLVIAPPYIRFYAGHPLIASSGLPIGTLCLLHSQPRQLSDEERYRLQDLAQLIEGHLKLRSLTEQTRYLREAIHRERRKALLDPLTQLWNRAALEHFYPVEQAAARRDQEQIGILFIDLDRFKSINDRYGHATGDEVLVETAGRIASSLRPHDVLMRFGGEEFVVIARVKTASQLKSVAERIRVAVASEPYPTTQGAITVTTSVGGTEGSPDEAVELLLSRADTALYQAKHEGRNRVVLTTALG
ncbi:diguanylate cyclase (GGDEF)-like protein [Pseudomonas duriflava]|uniref:diguanylate cyclase n=1 Tax=Pseudomonas duriflava TaxID=459528 RepID=A0A562QFL5_9PSED|nr:sensor domain-containing diguanylate cyclase [Pseudomonas duriflava]TWI54826.1 diguanylate cyclase (GGDEF)-like protein [Pseudomonas duriflava]